MKPEGGRPSSQPKKRWELFHHVSDIGVRGYGATLEEAFEQAGRALTGVMTDPDTVEPRDEVEIRCDNSDPELLFADWLNALVYEMATRGMVFSRFEVTLEGTRLRARVWGEPVDMKKHEPAVEVKAASYAELQVRPLPEGGWKVQCVVDV